MVRAHVPVRKFRGSRRNGRLIFMSLLAGMVEVGGRPCQAKSARDPTARSYVLMLNFGL